MKSPNLALVFPLALSVSITACAPKLDNDRAKVSYTIGQSIAENLKKDGIDVDPEIVGNSVRDGLLGRKSQLTAEQMQAANKTLQENMQKNAAKFAQENLAKSDAFMKENKGKPGVITNENGLQYIVAKDGTGPAPAEGGKITVKYTGKLLSGDTFDSTDQHGGPVELEVSQLFPGLRGGIMKMKEGGEATFFIPPALAFGATPRPGIPANSVIVYDVSLMKVAAPDKKAAAKAKKK